MPERRMASYRGRVERALESRLPAASDHPSTLHEAMRYAVLGGGKRLRPVLVYAAGAAVGVAPEVLDAPACAVELIHAYSLVHDDLPAMDDDDLRRGRPTCHKAYGEATAILAGDALQALAFQCLAEEDGAEPAVATRHLQTLARAAGSLGMVGGQQIDLAAVGQRLNIAELEAMHIRKTGALIRASVLLGAASAPDIAPELLERLDAYGKRIGLAFQIRDDILDVVGDPETIGKSRGADVAHEKPTYPMLLGLDGAREHASALVEDALASLSSMDERADTLRWIARYIVDRAY